MTKKIINTDKAPEPIGPYNQAVVLGNLVFTSGQIPIDPATGEVVPGGVAEQAEQVFKNLKAVLEACGSSLDKVIKATVFLQSMKDFPAMNEVYAKHMAKESAPARSTVEVARLPKDVLVEIETIAAC